MQDFLGDLGKDDDLGASRKAATEAARPARATFPCAKCRGTGQFMSVARGALGECFGCHGTGQSKYPPAQQAERRAKGKASAQKAEATKARKAAEWRQAHAAEVEWLGRASDRNANRGGSFTFPQTMLDSLAAWGSLTDNQLAAVRKLMARDVERTAQRAVEQAERVAAAPEVSTSKIEEAFDAARDNDIKWPALRLAQGGYVFTFKPARKHPGTLYVTTNGDTLYVTTNGDEYIGKVAGGRFICTRECSTDQSGQVVAAMNDPEQAAAAYGKRTGECGCCGRPLTNGESIDRGIGPVCATKYGW